MNNKEYSNTTEGIIKKLKSEKEALENELHIIKDNIINGTYLQAEMFMKEMRYKDIMKI